MSRLKFGQLLVGLVLTVNAFAVPMDRTDQETRELLASLDSVKNNREVLATLFKTGDARIDDLIKALDDPNPKVSLRAQRVIRYLGNPAGMKALEHWYSEKTETLLSGPIPIPLTQRDYQIIETQSADENFQYVYALALDGSERAQQLLEVMTKTELPDGSSTKAALNRIKRSQPANLMTERVGLAGLVLRNAFFVAPISRPHATAKLLALNQAKNKALIEVYVNPAPLAEEVYHVVIIKRDRGWQFFSITQIAVS
jgi:hypothetical protein